MTTTSVTEREAGTITEAEEQAKVASAAKVKTPVNEKVSSETPTTYTEKELKDAVKAAEGRALKADEYKQQAETYKSQAEQAVKEAKEATDTLEETRQHISNLESDIEALDEGEADPNKLSRLRKELREAKGNVRQEVKDEKDANAEEKKLLREEREANAELVAEAQTFKFDGEVAKIVDEYEGDVTANFTKLKEACEKASIKTKEGAEAIAETFMTKKVDEPDVLDDSSVTRGGSEDLNALSSKELRGQAYKPKKR